MRTPIEYCNTSWRKWQTRWLLARGTGSMALSQLKEMPMATRTSPPDDCRDQLNLFSQPSPRPVWNDLPEPTKQRLTQLLSEMLGCHLPTVAARDQKEEVTNE
jgi:Mg2+ and Co2+ transporter CorA